MLVGAEPVHGVCVAQRIAHQLLCEVGRDHPWVLRAKDFLLDPCFNDFRAVEDGCQDVTVLVGSWGVDARPPLLMRSGMPALWAAAFGFGELFLRMLVPEVLFEGGLVGWTFNEGIGRLTINVGWLVEVALRAFCPLPVATWPEVEVQGAVLVGSRCRVAMGGSHGRGRE